MAPRYSIIPGDFPTDPRVDIGHFRVLTLMGRHTDQHGWCRLKQLAIGEQIGLARETVCRKIADLVAWGYVEKHAADTTGRAIWYRTLMDRPAPPPRPVSDGSQVEPELHPTCDPRLTPGVIPSDHTRCDHTQSHNNDPSLTTKTPPLPPARRGARARDRFENGIEKILDEVRTAERARVLDALLAPLARMRRIDAPNVAFALGTLADWPPLAGLDDEGLAAVLDRLKASRETTVKPSDIEVQVRAEVPACTKRKATLATAARQQRLDPVVGPVWARVRDDMRRLIGAPAVDAWLATVVAVGRDGEGRLTLSADSRFAARYVEQNFNCHIEPALAAALPGVSKVRYTWTGAAP